MQKLRTLSHARLAPIWTSVQLGLPLDGEDGRTAQVMREHPEWYDTWDQLVETPGREVEVDGVNGDSPYRLRGEWGGLQCDEI
jgi:hypothetical protein